MATEITIPRLGWSMDEGTFGEWLKRDGDTIAPGDPLFTLESEKALQEIESVDGGILHILPGGPADGNTVQVGARIGWLLEVGEQPPSAGSAPAASSPSATTSATNAPRPGAPAPLPQKASEAPAADRLRISPRAARIAAALNLDPRTIAGSGRDGRIREADVRAAAAQSRVVPRGPHSGVSQLTGLRRTIADRMSHSHVETAPVTLTTQADAEVMVALRQRLKSAASSGLIPSFQDIIISSLALALQEHPLLNSRWTEAGPVQPDGIHIGLAVDTPDGLLVPVVRHADRMHLQGLASTTRDLIERARSRSCSAAELTGGTFTVTNLGGFGIDAFTPIINLPECAVLGIGAVRRIPVVLDDGTIAPRHRLTLSLTFDHRIIDGAPAARFLQSLVRRIEG
jgi:pyruvate dehydrogenase E2 component (dihydrolipoamide acetyltransferase)